MTAFWRSIIDDDTAAYNPDIVGAVIVVTHLYSCARREIQSSIFISREWAFSRASLFVIKCPAASSNSGFKTGRSLR